MIRPPPISTRPAPLFPYTTLVRSLLTVDSSLTYSIVDVLLGGRRGTAAMRIEGRPYTTIERNLVERLVAVVLNDLSATFDPLSPVNFKSEEHTSELQSLMRISYAVFCLKKKTTLNKY